MGLVLLHACLGIATYFVFPILKSAFGPGEWQCFVWAFGPGAAGVAIGWLSPAGAPAASVTALLVGVLRIDWSPEFVGPTARSLFPLHVCMALVPFLAMLGCEAFAAVRRRAYDAARRAAGGGGAAPRGGDARGP